MVNCSLLSVLPALFIVVVVLFFSCVHGQRIALPVDIISPSLVSQHVTDPLYSDTLSQLRVLADSAVQRSDLSVTFSPVLCETKNPHDYYSMDSHWVPDKYCNKSNPDYENTCNYTEDWDTANPDAATATQLQQATQLTNDLVALTVAALVFPESSVYSQRASQQLHSFFLANNTNMYPSLAYAQVRVGNNSQHKGRAEGVNDIRSFPLIMQTEGILNNSWTQDDHQALIQWFSSLSEWEENSAQGIAVRSLLTHHSTWYYCQQLAYAQYLGHNTEAQSLLMTYINTLYQQQFIAQGQQPYETNSTADQLSNTQALHCIAQRAQSMGMDFYHNYSINTHNITIKEIIQGTINTLTNNNTSPPPDSDKELLVALMYTTMNEYPDDDTLVSQYSCLIAQYTDNNATQIPISVLWLNLTSSALTCDDGGVPGVLLGAVAQGLVIGCLIFFMLTAIGVCLWRTREKKTEAGQLTPEDRRINAATTSVVSSSLTQPEYAEAPADPLRTSLLSEPPADVDGGTVSALASPTFTPIVATAVGKKKRKKAGTTPTPTTLAAVREAPSI